MVIKGTLLGTTHKYSLPSVTARCEMMMDNVLCSAMLLRESGFKTCFAEDEEGLWPQLAMDN